MSYTPNTWATGDTITASKLNAMEQGIANAGSIMLVGYDSSLSRFDKTVQEIYDAFSSSIPVYVSFSYGNMTGPNQDYIATMHLTPITTIYKYSTDVYRIMAPVSSSPGSYDYMVPAVMILTSSSMSAYPTFLRYVRVKDDSYTA